MKLELPQIVLIPDLCVVLILCKHKTNMGSCVLIWPNFGSIHVSSKQVFSQNLLTKNFAAHLFQRSTLSPITKKKIITLINNCLYFSVQVKKKSYSSGTDWSEHTYKLQNSFFSFIMFESISFPRTKIQSTSLNTIKSYIQPTGQLFHHPNHRLVLTC